MVLGLCDKRRFVACVLLLLMVGASTVQSQQVHEISPGAFIDCPVERLEASISSIEYQLNRMQRIVSALNNPSIKENCTIDLSAYGFDDSPVSGYIRTNGGSSEETYTTRDIGAYRGVTTVELDATTCTTRNRQRFDTHADAGDRVQLLETLQSATTGTIIVGVSADSVTQTTFPNAGDYTRYNINLGGLEVRDKFVFIMQKGYPKKTLFQRNSRYGGSLRMRIALRGSSIYDVTFNLA